MNRRRLQIRPRRSIHGAEGERGQILVLFTIVLVVILAFTALVVDIGLLRNDRQSLVNAVDAGALAGGTLMPVDGSQSGAAAKVTALINQTVQATYPGLSTSDYEISYRCLIGTGAGDPAAFDSTDIADFIPFDCKPNGALGHSPVVGDFTGAGKTRSSVCNPDLGDKCNVVVVSGNVTTPYSFARVVGVNSGSTGVVQSAACKGLCGELPTKYDVELVIDKSGSMQRNCSGGASDPRAVSPPNKCENVANSRSRIGWAGFAAKQLVTDLENAGGIGFHRVGITTFQGNPDETPLRVVSYDGKGGRQNAWTSTATQLKNLIDNITNQGEGNTPLRAGMAAAVADLNANARAAVNVKRVLILISDGRPQPDRGPNGLAAPNTSDPLTNQRPTQAGLAAYLGAADFKYSIMIGVPSNPYPIGYVVTRGNLDNNILDPDLMKLLATPDDLTAKPQPLRYYYPVAQASDLPTVFTQIANQILGAGARLIQLHPAPIVTAVGGDTTVAISGKYFTGATQVTFGGTNAAFTVNSDTSITATAPSGTPGQTVHVRVTTEGGSSPATAADLYTYP